MLAWINPREKDAELPAPVSTRNRKSFSGSILLSLSGCSNTYGVAKKTGLRISDVSLGPRGAMSIQLETQSDHLPQRPQNKKPRCALYRWGGVEMGASISYCATCNVNLCIDCYKMFHQNTNITHHPTYVMHILVFKFVGSVEGDHTVSPVELTLHLLSQDSHHLCAILSSLLTRNYLNNHRVTTDLNLKIPSFFLLTQGQVILNLALLD